MRIVLVDLDLSVRVSVPTSSLPTWAGEMLCFFMRFWTTEIGGC